MMQKRNTLVAILGFLAACGAKPVDSNRCEAYPDCDADNDGWTLSEGDCDDADSAVYPGAVEVWYDGVDSDCSGTSDFDADYDGVPYDEDCDDEDAASTTLDSDADCDGLTSENDCDDHNPAAPSLDDDGDCDGVPVDLDCDDADPEVGFGDEWYVDNDNDGYGSEADFIWSCDDPGYPWVLDGGDCDDANAGIHPGAPDFPEDGIDTDCDGTHER